MLLIWQDPVIAAAFSDISQNPANISKYQDNPKVKAVLEKLSKKFGGGGAGPFGGGAPGGPFGGAGGSFGGAGGPFGGAGGGWGMGGGSGPVPEQPDID